MMLRFYTAGQRRQLVSIASSFLPNISFPGTYNNSNTNNHDEMSNNETVRTRRYFSDNISLRRPPSRRRLEIDDDDDDTDRKWRSHAVSLEFGNYSDDDNNDDGYNSSYGDSGYSSARSRWTTARSNSRVPSTSLPETETPMPSSSSSWHVEETDLADKVQKIQQEADERRKKWLENAKPPLRRPVVDERGRSYGRGGRKTASARVWIQPGFGNVVVNRKELVDYFDRTTDREQILMPLAATATLGSFDVVATVDGGGLTGQAGAIRHGLARALNNYNPDLYRPPLKRLGYLTRDPRKVERKKIGHLKARKKPQWNRR